jgi:uncharacterized Ntn-hydrolase superfamily protein
MTYSIIAADARSSLMGVAVQSHWLAVGAIVPWAAAGTGVLATQANCDLAAGRRGMALLASGKTARPALNELLTGNARAPESQIAVLDASGRVAVHTGKRCVTEAGHRSGSDFSVQANMMLRPTVPAAMAAAWTDGANLPLADRMIATLVAAQAEGGDVRGVQSAAMLIVPMSDGHDQLEKVIDVRVDDSSDPIGELRRLAGLAEAYYQHELGLVALDNHDASLALEHWTRAAVLAPGNQELLFWQAVGLAATGNDEEARELLCSASATQGGWKTLLERLPAAGRLASVPGLPSEQRP